MFRSYFIIAIRSLLKQKAFSIINILGLALGMGVCFLIIGLVKDAHSYDGFHKDSDRIYRLRTTPIRKSGSIEDYASSPFMIGKTLADENPQVELWTPIINQLSGSIKIRNTDINFSGLLTDQSFFEMFGFELAQGNELTALTEPYTLVLSAELSYKLFKEESPIGKKLEIPGYGSLFKVTGVLDELPGKTHLEFDALGSLSTQFAEEKLPGKVIVTSEWRNYYSNYNFVRLNKNNDKKAVELAMANIAQKNYADLEFELRDEGYKFSLQGINEITPGPIMSNSMGRGMPRFLIWFLMLLGAVIMLSACFNYTNLTIARSLIRTKEVGVRKIIGASGLQVFGQFMVEAIVTAIIALGFAYLIMTSLKPLLLQLQFAEFTDLHLEEDVSALGIFLLFAIVVGAIAGLLPALTFANISPQAILQKIQNIKLIRRFGFRKFLLVIQLTLTLVFFIIITIAWQQVNYATKISFAYDQPKTLMIDMQGVDYKKLSTAFSKLSGVEEISAISFPMGTWRDRSFNVQANAEGEKVAVRTYFIDENYLPQFDLPLIAGDNFPENIAQQNEIFAIVNESFVEQFKLDSIGSPIGQSILVGDSIQMSIHGVLADFVFKPANYEMEPLLLRYDPKEYGTLNLSLAGEDLAAKVKALERVWKDLSDHSFNAVFYKDNIKKTYANMTDIIWIVGFFGLLSMIISCMGLLGIVIYLVKTKSKEISIRKILGADITDLIFMLSKKYIVLFGIAVLIATPISYLIGNQVLQIFASRIDFSYILFLPAFLLVFLIISLTIGSQTVKAAFANPSESLRND